MLEGAQSQSNQGEVQEFASELADLQYQHDNQSDLRNNLTFGAIERTQLGSQSKMPGQRTTNNEIVSEEYCSSEGRRQKQAIVSAQQNLVHLLHE